MEHEKKEIDHQSKKKRKYDDLLEEDIHITSKNEDINEPQVEVEQVSEADQNANLSHERHQIMHIASFSHFPGTTKCSLLNFL